MYRGITIVVVFSSGCSQKTVQCKKKNKLWIIECNKCSRQCYSFSSYKYFVSIVRRLIIKKMVSKMVWTQELHSSMVFDRPNERSPEKLVTTNCPSQHFLQPEDENKVSLNKFLKRSTFIVRLDLQLICFSLLSFSFDSKHSEFLGTAKTWNDMATFERLCYLYRKIQSQCCKLDVIWNKSGNVERSRCKRELYQ